jgi:CubicO group peptidase (beta-lactamase class C family)
MNPAAMADRTDVARARTVLRRAIADRLFPAAVAEVGDSSGPLWREAFGRLTFDDDAPATTPATIFDLASITKVAATTTVVMHLVAARRIDLDERVSALFPEWRGEDRAEVTVRDLLEHAAGLAPRLLDPPPSGRREFEHEISVMPLAYPPRSTSVYSDLGFILLGFLAEDRGGASLEAQFDAIRLLLETAIRATEGDGSDDDGEAALTFSVPSERRADVAPTRPLDDDPRRGTLLVGAVHDNYAAALGGVAGHSGLFGNAGGLGRFARGILRGSREEKGLFPPFTYPWVMKVARKSSVPGSSRGLGWDTMLPTSSCGSGMSFAAFGHVGFTGTSLWIDPILDRYFVLLTNRAYGSGSIEAMRDVRRAFHDAVVSLD